MGRGFRKGVGGGAESKNVSTILGDLTGSYVGLALKTSAIKVPEIISGQWLQITGRNNASTTWNYQIVVEFSTDGSNWVRIYTSNTIPFPTSGVYTTLNINLNSLVGNSGYFRIGITGDSRANNTITSAILKASPDKNIIVNDSGYLNPKYLLQGIASQGDVAVKIVRTQSTGVHGYIIGFDFTNISKLIFTIYSAASGYIYVRSLAQADQLATITNDTSHILTYEVDVSAYTGVQPIIIACNNYAEIGIRQLTAT